MEQYEIVKQLLKARNTEEIEVALSRVNVYNYSSVIRALVARINTIHMENDGCNCCNGDEALFYQNGDTNAFIDSKGNVDIMIDGATMRFTVKNCPNCGRAFDKEN